MHHHLDEAIACLEERHVVGGIPRGLSREVRFLRGARLARTAAELGGTQWARAGEASDTGAARAALWRYVLLHAAVDQMHRAAPVAIAIQKERCAVPGLDTPCDVPGFEGIGRAEVRAAIADLPTRTSVALQAWLGGAPLTSTWQALQVGYGLRNAVAHGAVSPTMARQWRLVPALDGLFDVNVAWVVALARWRAPHVTEHSHGDAR